MRSSASGIFHPTLRNLSVGILLGVLLIAFESLAVATVLPKAVPELGGLSLYGWSFSAFFMGYLLSTVLLGALADRRGPALPLALALGAFGAGLCAAGLAPNMPLFIAGRSLQGLGGGGLIAVAYLAINRAYPDALRARMLALLSSAWVLPALVGPLIASWVAQHFSWRTVFLGLVPLLAAVVLLALPPLRAVRAAGTPIDRLRARAALFAALGVTLVLAALQQRALPLGLLLGLLGAVLAVPALRSLFPPLTWRAGAPLEAGYATRFLLTFSFFGAEAFVPLSLTALRGLSTLQAGLALTLSALTWSGTSILHSRFDERTGGRYRPDVARAGAAVVALSLALSGLVLLSPGLPIWPIGFSWALGGLGMGLAFQSHTLVVFHFAPEGQEGQVSGTLQMADVLGSALGAGLGGVLVAALGLRGGVMALFTLSALAVSLGLYTAGRLRAAPQRERRPG